AHTLAWEAGEEDRGDGHGEGHGDGHGGTGGRTDRADRGDKGDRGDKEGGGDGGAGGDASGPGGEAAPVNRVQIDPLGELARAAGYDDAERWWEDAVEHRGGGKGDPFAPFTALEEAMTALRETHGSGGHERDLAREA